MIRSNVSLPDLEHRQVLKIKFQQNDENNQLSIIQKILSKPQDQRNTHDLKTLVPLMLGIKFFAERKLKDKEITEVCSGLEYLQLKKE